MPVVPALPAGHGQVSLQFAADCWIQLSDAQGQVLASGLKRAGEQLNLTGQAPLELRLGYARGASVSYNGQAIDTQTHLGVDIASTAQAPIRAANRGRVVFADYGVNFL